MKKMFSLFLALCLLNHLLQSITFNIALDKSAEVDIELSTEAITDFSMFGSSANKIIARYSFLLNSLSASGQVLLRQALFNVTFSSEHLPRLAPPEARLEAPTVENNPFVITLTPSEIQALAGSVSQIYVTVRQRTYAYNAQYQKMVFFGYEILKQDYEPLNAVITVIASGVTAPSKFAEVPSYLQTTYPVASGSAI